MDQEEKRKKNEKAHTGVYTMNFSWVFKIVFDDWNENHTPSYDQEKDI